MRSKCSKFILTISISVVVLTVGSLLLYLLQEMIHGQVKLLIANQPFYSLNRQRYKMKLSNESGP